jgi:hypothetical protein
MSLQLVIDCADPTTLARFWMEALGYIEEPPPAGYETWNDYWRAAGLGEDELDDRIDRIVAPDGAGPRIWFQPVPERKTLKNRLHLDLTVSGGRTEPIALRRERVDAKVARLEELGATRVMVHDVDGLDHYGVTLQDPEGNEFCVN